MNGRMWKEDCPAACIRNETMRATRYYGRAFWNRGTAYYARSRVEATPLVTLLRNVLPGSGCTARKPSASGSPRETPTARPPDRRNSHPHRSHEPLLGTAEIDRVARRQRGKEKSHHKPDVCDNAHGRAEAVR